MKPASRTARRAASSEWPHLFAHDSPYLDSDAVFGVRDSLIVHYDRHEPGTAPDGRQLDRNFHIYIHGSRELIEQGGEYARLVKMQQLITS